MIERNGGRARSWLLITDLQCETSALPQDLTPRLASAGFEHHAVVTGGGYRSMQIPEFQWLNTVLGNVKNSLHGSYHHASGKHLPRYLGEFAIALTAALI